MRPDLSRWLILPLLLLGCGGGSPPMTRESYSAKEKDKAVVMQPPGAGVDSARTGEAGAKAQAPNAPPPEATSRKIVYTAEAQIVVEEFEKAERELAQLVKEHKGYVAQAETGGSSGSPRAGRWKVRIPVERFEEFLEAVAKLGVPQRISRDSKDVTEEFYDLEARLKAKKVQETRLLKHLEASTGKLEDILHVERELTRVRGEIEREEGRLRLLANLTALTTVTVHLQEIKNYVPPQAPTFGNTISSTFSSSLDALVNFGKGLVIAVVALAPWLVVLTAVGGPIGLMVRARWRGRAPARGSSPASSDAGS
jgi:hypothetical protein